MIVIAVCLSVCAGLAQAEPRKAEPRTYRQFKDVAVKEKGQVAQSADKDNLFEYTYVINDARTTITRTKVRRLDQTAARDDKTVYNITQKQVLPGSESGNGGKVLIAVRKDGGEILELGHRFAFTMRVSPFSQVISGIYKRVYDKDRGRFRRHDQPKP
ncbi:MAG TPA: hypothetical protein VMT55_05845 [Candidatus Sulfotelmatobacter sp.]|nr:hypothetical protein [Candidatus Sulfotelmatobacter sp.]